MYGVFSNYLVSRYSRQNESTIESALDHMRELTTAKSKFEYDPVLSDHHVVCMSHLTKDEYFKDCDYIYECLTNHHLMLLIRWINKNIVLRCSESVYSTNVRLRIATCMLNKLEEANFVSKRHALWFHEILVANIADLRNSLLDDMLPF